MSLNDPRWGNQGNDDDRNSGDRRPGGDRFPGDRDRGDNQGPPDLEEMWRDFNQRLSGMFGGKRRGGGGPQMPNLSAKEFSGGIWMLLLVLLSVWLATGFYTVDAYQRAVVLRFGKLQEVTGPGWHWRLPYPIESHEKVDKTVVRVVEVGYRNSESNKMPREALMLTDDENIINIQFAVQYVIDLSANELNRNLGNGAVAPQAPSANPALAQPEESDLTEGVDIAPSEPAAVVPEEVAAEEAEAREEQSDVERMQAILDENETLKEIIDDGEPEGPSWDKAVENYLFKNRDPDEAVRQAAETAMREIVGKSKMDFVLYDGREQIAVTAQELMQRILDRYQTGILISRVTMQNAQPPEQVQAAFDDAVRASQDRERQRNEGEAYANNVVPTARGQAARIMEEANGYRQRVVARAEGDASRFDQIYAEFVNAPEVTRERWYLEAMQQMLSNSSKVLIDANNGGNVLLMPLDKLLQRGGQTGNAAVQTPMNPALTAPPAAAPSTPNPTTPLLDSRDREALRNRGGR